MSRIPRLAENRAGDTLGTTGERKESVGQTRYLYIHIVCYLLVSNLVLVWLWHIAVTTDLYNQQMYDTAGWVSQ